MSDTTKTPAERWGLLANGSTRLWEIVVDESLDRTAWSMQIDGPHVYLAFQLQDLQIISSTLRFLKSRLGTRHTREMCATREDASVLTVGRFGSSPISLRWDDEDVARCYLVVGAEAGSALHLELNEGDIEMFVDALEQVVADLPIVAQS